MNLKKEKQKQTKQTPRTETELQKSHGDHMEGYQWGGGEGKIGEKVQGIRRINGRHKIDRGRLRRV